MVEIESVINARPITYVYDDTNSISYPLTPSDLVYGRRVILFLFFKCVEYILSFFLGMRDLFPLGIWPIRGSQWH